MKLPVLASVRHSYVLLWRHRSLHARAIWPPILFLVAAEFLFHKVVGNAHEIESIWNTLASAPWYWPVAIGVLWLAGLKFLLSFSISWRRHILLGEKFDAFYFKKPFWKYLAALAGVYLGGLSWLIVITFIDLLISSEVFYPYGPFSDVPGTAPGQVSTDIAIAFFTTAALLWGIISSILRFTALAISDEQITLRRSWHGMRRNVLSYLAIWVLAMAPVFGITWLLSLADKAFGIDMHSTPVALGESAFRQACLFVCVSLGASIGAFTYQALVRGQGPETIE